jgi:serine/threonine-protein kinase RsbW
MVGEYIVAFPAIMQSLYEMLAFIRAEAGRAGFDPSSISKIELAAEEALVNVIKYGYPGPQSNENTIHIGCTPLSHGGIKILIRDKGISYNPLGKNLFTAQPSPDAQMMGGYGIFFILHLMDEVNYNRDGDFNILSLIKRRSGGP